MSGPVVSVPTPHPGQARILASPARHKLVRCGRRFGKTNLGIHAALVSALHGGKVGWFAPNTKYALEAWREIVKRLKPAADLEGGRVSEQEKRIELPNGGYIEVWSLHDNDDPARGRSYDLVVVDEAGLVGTLSTLWDAALEPTLMDREGKALFLGTPKGARTPFNVMFAEAEFGQDAEWAAFHGKTVDNITIKDIARKVERARVRAERRGTLAIWRQEYEGVPCDDGSNPIGLEAIRAAVTPKSEQDVVVWGVDLARSVDFTVVIGLDCFGRWARLEKWQGDWGETKRKLLLLVGRETPCVMDATGVGSPIVQDLQYAGMQVTPFVFSRKSRGAVLEDLVTAIHGKRLGIPDGWVRAELESLGVEHNSETNFTRYSVPDGMHDDGIMALALAWRAYLYFADTPSMDVRTFETPWVDGVDASQFLAEEADAAFAALGDGW